MLPAFLTKSWLFTAVPRCYPFTGYLFLSQPPRSHARQAQGKKERGSFLPFTMETALYPKDCTHSAAVSLPPLPQPQRPHEPPAAPPHPGSRLSAQQVTATHPARTPGEAGLLSTSSCPASDQQAPCSQFIPFPPVLLSSLPVLRLSGLRFSPAQAEPGQSPAVASQPTHSKIHG